MKIKKEIDEAKRKLRRLAYEHAPKSVKRKRYAAFNAALADPTLWRAEPKQYYMDQPD